MLGLGRGPGHRDAGTGDVAVAVDLGRLGPDLDDEATDATIADDDVAPPPQHEVRDGARAREPDERAQLEGVAHDREQVRGTADAHRREPGERLVARGLDADPALDVGPDRDRVERGRRIGGRDRGHAGSPRDRRSMASGVGPRAPRRGGHHEIRDGVRGAGSTERRAPPPTSRGGRAGSSRMVAASSSAPASKASSSTSRAAPASTSWLRVGALVAGGVRIRHDDHRQTQGGHLGQGGRTGPPDHEVRGGQRGQHVVAQERMGLVARAHIGRQGLTTSERRGVPIVAGDVDDGDPLHEPGQGLGDGGVEPADGLRTAEDQQDPHPVRDAEPEPGGLAIHLAGVADRACPVR